MARPTDSTGYPGKSIYRTPLTTDGQYMVASSGATIDIYGKFIGEAGSSMTIGGKATFTTGAALTIDANVTNKSVQYTSHAAAMPTTLNPGWGVKVINSTDDRLFYIPAPSKSGAQLKLVLVTSTNGAGVNNAVTRFVVTTKLGKGRFYSSGRMIALTTCANWKRGVSVDLVGTTSVFGARRSWILTNIWPYSSGAPAALVQQVTLTTTTD